jgi:hypothetical protein
MRPALAIHFTHTEKTMAKAGISPHLDHQLKLVAKKTRIGSCEFTAQMPQSMAVSQWKRSLKP